MGTEAETTRMGIREETALDFAALKTKIARRLALGISSQVDRLGLKRDLAVAIERPQAKIPVSVRPARRADLERLLSGEGVSDAMERQELNARRSFADKVAGGAYVAIDERNGAPCYVQWLLGPQKNEVIGEIGGFPLLAEGEALLEDAYTPPSHRGLGIMSAAMALIAERGADIGARHVITFVGVENIASLKGCKKAGFHPYLVHTQRNWLFGTIRTDRFEDLPAGDPRREWAF
jgi:RimJ/RimL family protein N-acetyltransferase